MTDSPEHVEGQLQLDGQELTEAEVLSRTSATAVRVDISGFLSDWLETHEAWPDGAPSGVWTAETFAAVLAEDYTSPEQMIHDMGLMIDYTITVTDDKGRTAVVEFED